jgi:CRP/FNR family cyclic AMP-dependent transcriptional regulator
VKASNPFRLSPFFSMLTEAETSNLLKRGVTKRVEKGKALFHKGDAGTGMYVVLEGRVAVSVDMGAGYNRPLYGPGDVVGEISMFDGKGRISGAITLEDSSLKFVSRRDFQALLFERPDLAAQVIGYLCGRLRRLHDDADARNRLDVPARLARLVLSLHQRFVQSDDSMVLIRFTQSELAALLGLSREWVGRELIKWRDAHIIDLSRRRIVIRDRPALERILAQSNSRISAL